MRQPTGWPQDPQSKDHAEQAVSAFLRSIEAPPELNAEKRGLLIAATIYHEAGWSVIPVVGKKPTQKWKRYSSERMSRRTLLAGVIAKSVTGVAVVCGELSDVVVVDFDGEAGAKAFETLQPMFPPGTLVARTGSGGYHAYFAYDDDLKTEPFAWDGERAGEIRSEGALAVLPPSTHPKGGSYEWMSQ